MSRDGYVQRWVGMSRGWVPSGGHHTYGWQAGGMHPTGMLSCYCYMSIFSSTGASVVTLCELLDYIVMHCLAGCKRRKRNDVKSFNNQMNEQHTGETEKKPVTNFGMYQ